MASSVIENVIENAYLERARNSRFIHLTLRQVDKTFRLEEVVGSFKASGARKGEILVADAGSNDEAARIKFDQRLSAHKRAGFALALIRNGPRA
jgi:hypothetical protein